MALLSGCTGIDLWAQHGRARRAGSGPAQPGRYRSISAFSPIAHPSAVPWGHKAFGGYLGDDRTAWEAVRRDRAGATHHAAAHATGTRNIVLGAISALSPIAVPSAMLWGHKAPSSHMGGDRAAWHQYDVTDMVRLLHDTTHSSGDTAPPEAE